MNDADSSREAVAQAASPAFSRPPTGRPADRKAPVAGLSSMELAGLEPATSWVRFHWARLSLISHQSRFPLLVPNPCHGLTRALGVATVSRLPHSRTAEDLVRSMRLRECHTLGL